MATRKINKSKDRAQNSAKKSVAKTATSKKPRQKRNPRGKGKPFSAGNPWRFPPGKSGNPGGRPKVLGESYSEWLKLEDKSGITNAMRVAVTMGSRAILGDVQAAKEIRMATEGTTLNTWQSEIIALLKEGKLTPKDVIEELGDGATELLVAAGLSPDAGRSAQGEGKSETAVADTAPELDAKVPPDAGA